MNSPMNFMKDETQEYMLYRLISLDRKIGNA